MPQEINLEFLRKELDREITFFNFKKARKIVEKGLRTSLEQRDDFFLNYFLAQEEILDDNFVGAIKYLNRALKIRPDDGCSYNDKGLCLAELGDKKTALNCFNQGLSKDPDCAPLYHNKGWLLNFLDQNRQAILCFSKALELDPGRPEALYSIADSYLKLREPKRAKKYFQQALSAVKGKSPYMSKNIVLRLKKL